MSIIMNADDGSVAECIARLESPSSDGWRHRVRLVVGMATFLDSFDIFSIAFVMPVMAPLWHLSPVQVGMVFSIGFLGQMIGSVVFGFFSERYGRIRALSVAVFIFAVATLLSALVQSAAQFEALRFIQGLGLGGHVPIAATYITEISRQAGRGRFVLLYESIFAVGNVLAAVICRIFLSAFGWQSIFWLSGVAGVLLLPFVVRLPESPRWLCARGQARYALDLVRGLETGKPQGPGPLPVSVHGGTAGRRRVSLFLPRDSLRLLLLTVPLWFALGFLNYGLATWLPIIYTRQFRLPVSDALDYSIIRSVIIFIGTIACSLAIDAIGRRKIVMGGFLCAALPLVALALMGSAMTAGWVFFMTLITSFFVAVLMLAVYLYTPELCPAQARGAFTGFNAAVLRFASMIAPGAVGLGMSHGSIAGVFMLFAAVGLMVSGISFVMARETRHLVM